MKRYLTAILSIVITMAGCSMIDLSANPNFQEQLDNGGKPAIIVHVQEDVVEAEKTLEADWAANTAESNVDYTSSPPNAGDVILATSLAIQENFETINVGEIVSSTRLKIAQRFSLDASSETYGFTRISLEGSSNGVTLRIGIYNDDSGEPGSLIAVANDVWLPDDGGYGGWYDFDLDTPDLQPEIDYYIVMEAVSPASGEWFAWSGDNTNGYSKGEAWEYLSSTWSKIDSGGTDLTFRLYSRYAVSGNITTDNFDLGSTPTVSGEWQMQDTKPDGTSLTYEAWSSATGVFGGEETYLGIVADGDPITNLKDYYRVKSSLTASANRDKTPTIHSIKADFSTYKTFTDSQRIGQENDYEMGLMPISGISSEINDFKESTIGQITPVIDFNESISKYLYGKYPKNKIVKVLIGFDDPAFPVSDFLEFFRGQIVDYNLMPDDKVALITQAFQVEWNKKVPETWEDVGDDVTWTNVHPIDVMLDIIRNYMTVRDSKIVASSFAEVKALIPSYTVTRTITKNPVEAKKLMEELRLLTSSYFLPRSDGKIKIKRFDPTEAVVATLTDANTKDMGGYKGNLKTLINKTLVYFAHDGDGDDAADYAALAIDVTTGADSHDNWGEWKTKEVKDKWTLDEDLAQVVSMSDVQLARYKNPPAILQRVGDKKLLYIEAGDMVAVTTKRAPSADGVSGIVDKKFQVIKPSLDFKGDKVTLMLLEV